MTQKLSFLKPGGAGDIYKKLAAELDANYGHLLPPSKEGVILLKPNLNSNMNALTGNTTDLRLIAAVVKYLKSKGYRNIVIGEGTNSGFYREGINVISRLYLDALAKALGVEMLDFNYAPSLPIEFEGGVQAEVARVCIEADLFINMPKLKMHYEVGMTVCLKSLIGCLKGLENKKKTHSNLAGNILNLNRKIKPHIQIVDGLIAMEGLGPTRGTPVNTGVVLIGTDPYAIDMACARLAHFDYRLVTTLKLAEEQGLITEEHRDFLDTLDLKPFTHVFEPPKPNVLVRIITHPKWQKYFIQVRNTGLFNYLFTLDIFTRMLFLLGIRQEVMIFKETRCDGLHLLREKCDKCGKCTEYCPLELPIPAAFEEKGFCCINCLYCYLVCPARAIAFEGELGFLREQISQYDEIVRRIA